MKAKLVVEEAMRLKATADIGLLYCVNPYDRERYETISEISRRLMEMAGSNEIEAMHNFFIPASDYPTAKVDIRALILSSDGKILLAKESADERWSLPGGWADIGASPCENIIRECKEETGLDVVPERLLAVFDKSKHAHPPQAEYVYKLVFLCRSVSSVLMKGFDVLDVGYFALDQLPELSENRILKTQIELAYQLALNEKSRTYFD